MKNEKNRFNLDKNFFTSLGLASALLFNSAAFSTSANAAMVDTSANAETNPSAQVQHVQHVQIDKESLLVSMQSDELREQLVAYGVDPEMAEQRVNSLTQAEIDQLNAEFAAQPAGAGVLGAAVTVFIVLVITDMLCATDVFTFVRCVNR